jgi:hypothetical protein
LEQDFGGFLFFFVSLFWLTVLRLLLRTRASRLVSLFGTSPGTPDMPGKDFKTLLSQSQPRRKFFYDFMNYPFRKQNVIFSK